MIVDLTQIDGSRVPFDFRIPAGDLALDDQLFGLTEDVRVSGELTSGSAQIDVSGTISGKAEIACTRCLEPVSRDVLVEFAVGFVTPENFGSDKEHEVASTELDTDVFDGERINLKEIAREQILLSLPDQVFCRPDCKGLCPKCGVDRNLIDCNCSGDEPDPRWAGLQKFLDDEKSEAK